jgi:hypothetical protein
VVWKTFVRVLIVIDSLEGGGAQRQALLLLQGLRRKGVDAKLWYYRDVFHYRSLVTDADLPHIRYLPRTRGTRGKAGFLWALRDELRDLAPDYLISFLRHVAVNVALASTASWE